MMRLLGDRVLVALPPKETVQEAATGYTYQEKVTASGLIIAKPADAYEVEVATRGIVMALGEKRGAVDIDEVRAVLHEWTDCTSGQCDAEAIMKALQQLARAPFDVEVGDCVIFAPSAGEQFVKDGITYAILNESEIAGVLTPNEVAA